MVRFAQFAAAFVILTVTVFSGSFPASVGRAYTVQTLSLIHISEPTRLLSISYAVFCLKTKTH